MFFQSSIFLLDYFATKFAFGVNGTPLEEFYECIQNIK
jgi:hypothetical protein